MTGNYLSTLKVGAFRNYKNFKTEQYVLKFEEMPINQVDHYSRRLVKRYGDDGIFDSNKIFNSLNNLKRNNNSLKQKESFLETIAEAFADVDNFLDNACFQDFKKDFNF